MWGILRIFAAREVWAARPDPTKTVRNPNFEKQITNSLCIPYAIVGSRIQLLIYLIFFADILQECDVMYHRKLPVQFL